MRTYETLFITLPTLAEEEERAMVQGLGQIVADAGGVFAVKERMGRRRLAYPIQKHEDGVYTRFLYDAEPSVPKELGDDETVLILRRHGVDGCTGGEGKDRKKKDECR